MPHRVLGQIVAFVPFAGATVKHGGTFGDGAQQSRPQHVGEEVVIAVPLTPVVEGNDEEIRSLQHHEHRATTVMRGDRIAQRTAEAVEDRGLKEEVAHIVGLALSTSSTR